MNIYEQEKQDGLEAQLSTKASVSYACLLQPSDTPTVSKDSINNKTIAAAEDKDLYYVQSILVTSSWNKNDDVFDKQEVWAARKTPEDKPTNLEHDEGTIIGHITQNWPITEDGILIDEATPVENLPEKFHILTGAVIYRGFSNPELSARAENLIQEIEDGTKYVSMECYFRGFDYGLTNQQTGEYKVLARSEETSYLTKHLRAYGGLGEHEGYKIGRVLRDITFSGKGYVDKPANPDSIILNTTKIEEEKKAAFIKAGVNEQSPSNTENNTMNLEKEVAELQEKVEAMTGCGEAVKEAYTLASSLKDRITELEGSLAEEKTANETLSTQLSEAQAMTEEEKKKKEEEMKKMQASVEELEEALAAYKNKEEEMKKKEEMMKRKASLLDLGIDSEVADATVEKFAALDDETFSAMSELLNVTAKKDKKEEEMKKEKMQAAEEALESAEPEVEADLSVGGEIEESEVESTRAALVDFMYTRLNKAQPNKGE